MERGFLISENLYSDSHLEILTESTDKGKRLWLEGPCVMTNRINRNGRNYDYESVGIPMVERYNEEYVAERRAIGECEHPDYPFPKMKEAAVMLKEPLRWEKYDAVGKLLVLNNQYGQIITSLAEAGYNLGVSTRGLGSSTMREKVEQIDKGFMLTAVDVVDKPSGQSCYVDAIRESVEWIMESDGSWRPNSVNGAKVDRYVKHYTESEQLEIVKRFKAVIDRLG